MRKFDNYNPIIIFVYLIIVICITMFSMNPILIFISLSGGIVYFNFKNNKIKIQLMYLILFLIMILINPLFSHNGKTILFFINDNPITLESLIYGCVASGMIMAVIYWFNILTEIMTSEKLLYVFNKVSPKVSLILSMAFRYIPLFNDQSKKIKQTQTVLGLYKDGNIIDKFIGGIRIFSIMITWALENGITTADSMTSRGYGIGKRTSYSVFKITKKDILLFIIMIILSLLVIVNMILNNYTFNFYPEFVFPQTTTLSIIGYISYGIIVFAPTINDFKENKKWQLLQSKI